MSDHSKTFVALESWSYQSPDVRLRKQGTIDLGLLAEALIYYDQVIVNIINQPQFAEFLRWFINQGKYADLLALLADKTLTIYDYAFTSTAVRVERTSRFTLMNIQDQTQAQPNTFRKRFLYHDAVQRCFRHARDRVKLYKALEGKVIEVKADEFGRTIRNAKGDFQNPERSALVVQAFFDEAYQLLSLGKPPRVTAQVEEDASGDLTTTWSTDIGELSKKLGPDLNFDSGTSITAAVHANRLIWSAGALNSDLYVGRPMSTLIGDKLYEVGLRVHKLENVIQRLVAEVEFPDIKTLVNDGTVKIDDVLYFRKKAQRFRTWLQQEGERDRDAIIAYHHEVAKDSGWTGGARKSLSLFGCLGGAALGQVAAASPAIGAIGGAAVGRGFEFLLDVASKMGANWKPVIFGNWISGRIEKILQRQKS